MPQLPFRPSQRKLLVGSAIALALFANPYGYDFDHQQWQVNQAYAQSCFIAGTLVLMADGSERPIETLLPGERVRDPAGHSNRIVAIERVILGERRLYGINRMPPFFTAEHPLLTTRGWAAINPAMTRAENPSLAIMPLFTGMRVLQSPGPGSSNGNLALAPQWHELQVEALNYIDALPTTPLFNLLLDGSHSYIANSLIVHNKGDSGGDDGGSSGSGGGGGGGGDDGGSSGSGGDDGGGGSGSSSGGGGDDGGSSGSSGSSGSGSSGGDNSGHGSNHSDQAEHSGGHHHQGEDHRRGLGNGADDFDANGNKLRGDGTIDDNGVDAVDASGNKLRGDGTIDDNGVDAVDASGNKLRGDGTIDDNGVDAVDANGNKLRGDGTIDDNGVDAVDANGNKLRGDGTIDDNGVDAVDASGNKLRGDGTIDDNGVDAVDASGNKLKGDGTADDRGQTLTDEQEKAAIANGFQQ